MEIDNYFVHKQTVKFRISDHSLMIEKGRHHRMLREDRICKQCDIGCIEDELNSICLNITPITGTSGNLLIFSTPTMAKYLEICLFISTKALKYSSWILLSITQQWQNT